ncbi:hypothetical protein [Pseudovibrio sp. POLY-S9]|uniref:hypothetical protein n=1 Tax=Pseudovibrio sp. POLY-S9 TaxID=1576596 RepID=UPI0007093F8F|nr:hypothetical protein [Pseudovibrio sp. POLY-S9]
MELAGARLSFSFTNRAGNFDPTPIMTQGDVSVRLIKEVLEFKPDNELRKASADASTDTNEAGRAVSKIFEILVGLDLDKMNTVVNKYVNKIKSKEAAIQKFFDVSEEWTNPESKSVKNAIYQAMKEAAAEGDHESWQMLQALDKGELSIEDMADYGLETESNYIVYLDEDGSYVYGISSVNFTGKYRAAHDVFSEQTTLNENGQAIDKETGNRAAYIRLAKNLSFYLTWPSD